MRYDKEEHVEVSRKTRHYVAYPESSEKLGFKCCLFQQQLTPQPEFGPSLIVLDILNFYKNYRLRGLLEQANMTNFSFFSQKFCKNHGVFFDFFSGPWVTVSRSVGGDGYIHPLFPYAGLESADLRVRKFFNQFFSWKTILVLFSMDPLVKKMLKKNVSKVLFRGLRRLLSIEN